jgi:predicted secreted hydrolase
LNQLSKNDSHSQYQYQLPQLGDDIRFPRDHQPHKNYRHEWWYLTANLTTAKGQQLSTQFTLFRSAVNQRHWYFAHGALSDSKRHLNALRNGREDFGNVTIAANPFVAKIDDWLWQSSAQLLPATLSYGDDKDPTNEWQVKLSLTNSGKANSSKANSQRNGLDLKVPFFLQGEQGYSRKHAKLNIASHYYSQPFIEVTGEVLWQGQWQQVTGQAWFDREWGSQLLAPDQQGWDWFSLRLNQDTALMVYRIRSTVDDYIYANLMFRGGSSKILSAAEIKITTAAAANAVYPNSFRLVITSQQIDIEVKIVNDQQINRFGIEYFEGMATFSGSHQGRGFVEMTGYR